MLTAKCESGQWLNLVDGLPDREKLTSTFFCPGCHGQVRLKKGQIMRPHFAHISLKNCQYFSENESVEHLTLKSQLYRWGKLTDEMHLEFYLPEINQIADLILGDLLVLEVQCSSLSLERLKIRTQAYHGAGYQVIWLLGKKLWLKQRLTSLQRQCLYFSNNRGFHLWELDSERHILRLKYLIHEDLHGCVQYLTEEFPMQVASLLTCLRQPFCQQPLKSFQGRMEENPQTYIAQQLYYRVPKWLERQSLAYQSGKNLLIQPRSAFYPQIQPVKQEEFYQIRQDLSAYYQNFQKYYQNQTNKSVQTLYSPAFYGKMCLTEEF